MLYSPTNFLAFVKQLVTGGGRDANGNIKNDSGFWIDRPDVMDSSVLATSVTRVVDSDGYPVLSAAASITALAAAIFTVPRDYDEATDVLRISFVAKMGGATDTPTLTIAVKKKSVGGAASTLTAVSGATTAALSTTAQRFEVEYRGQSLKRNDQILITLTSGAHTTDAIQLQSISTAYLSTLVSYNAFDASNTDLRG